MSTQRLQSLDAFRGFTVAAMLLVNNPGTWTNVYAPLLHAQWHGWTFTDWVFPFFVFISGISMGFSLSRRSLSGADNWQVLLDTSRRALIIIGIGLALNFIPSFDLNSVRIPGVLQRLGLCTLLAAPIVLWCGTRAIVLWALALMSIYAAIQLGVAVPDAGGTWHRGVLEPGKDVGAWLDRTVFGNHLLKSTATWDPEGILSTMPAVASQLLGVLAGKALAWKDRSVSDKAMTLAIGGLVSLWIGEIGDAWLMPINKSLWTPSYVFAMNGWALLLFSSFYWLLDGMPDATKRARAARLASPFVVFGMNALFLFALSALVAKAISSLRIPGGEPLKAALYAPLQSLPIAPENASLLFAIAFVSVMYGVAHVMWRNKWFVKV